MKNLNRLQNEKSPYLLQHAANPVDWYPWGDEAVEAARKSGRPIFLSIGYSTCHWCHVMAHESFENEKIAAIMNQHFINIKVDREERPDLDSVYMTAVHMMTGSGGWPLSAWLTPDLKPFFGGTYFPPEERYGRPGFGEVLTQIAQVWEKDKEKVTSSSQEIADLVEQSAKSFLGPIQTKPEVEALLDSAFRAMVQSFDSVHGGFGQAPKFPMPVNLEFLLAHYARTQDQKALDMVTFTMKKMAQGGLYDQLGGGFARYSTDEKWLVPHFEKMLYDNAQLISVCAALFKITNDSFFSEIARHSLSYILRDMTHADGAFYSAEDADSEGKEGTVYLWTLNEIKTLLPADQAEVFCHFFGVTVAGNFFDPHTGEAGKNVLSQVHPLEGTKQTKLLQEAKQTLFEARSKRPRPHLDDKIITGWNGLMISALAKSALVFEDKKLTGAAERAATFIEKNLFDMETGQLYRRWRDGERKILGHQSDYAFFIQGLLDIFEANGNIHWLNWAISLQEKHDLLFSDPEKGGYFMTVPLPDLLFRIKDEGDNVIPAGNSIAVWNGWRLFQLTKRNEFLEAARRTVACYSKAMDQHPTAFMKMLTVVEYLV